MCPARPVHGVEGAGDEAAARRARAPTDTSRDDELTDWTVLDAFASEVVHKKAAQR